MAGDSIEHPSQLVNLAGQRFGRWIVLGELPRRGRHRQWLCRCDCGTESRVYHTNLAQGLTRSCGCLRHDTTPALTHGMTGTRIYHIWKGMRQRCTNQRSPAYAYYGGRGITVCDRWLDFTAFWKDVRDIYRDELSIDRINNDGNYEPGNIRFSSATEQANNRSNGCYVTIDGVTRTIAQWAKRVGLQYTTIRHRIRTGWDPVRAVLEPLFVPQYVTAQGLTLTIGQWEKRTGIDRDAIASRIKRGWSAEKAVSIPPKHPRTR